MIFTEEDLLPYVLQKYKNQNGKVKRFFNYFSLFKFF